jgi:hypothetical protein
MAILSCQAGLGENIICGVDEVTRKNIETVLEKCAGLRLALAVAGRAIRASAGVRGQTFSGAVLRFVNRLQSDSASSIILGKKIDEYPGLTSVQAASLEAASQIYESESDVLSPASNLSIKEMYTALCVLQKQAWALVSMLKRL